MHSMRSDIEDINSDVEYINPFDGFFELGYKKPMPKLLIPPFSHTIERFNLGSGKNPIKGVRNLDRPGWEAPVIPCEDGRACEVHMHHFLEHLSPEGVLEQLQEVSRVLCPEGIAYITVPHAAGPLAYQALDHRTFWTEEMAQDLFYSNGYDAMYGLDLQLDISFMMIAALEARNLQLFIQLVKAKEDGERFPSLWRRN